MSRIDILIRQYCPDGVEYKNIETLCDISRGIVISKNDIKDNPGEYPVYSSQTENNGELGRISTYMYDGEYLTWTTDGANAGSVFYRDGKFNITNVCGLLKIKSKEEVLIRYLYHVLLVEAPKAVYKGMGNPKLMSNQMARVEVPLPALPVQREIVRILDEFSLLSAELAAELAARKQQYEFYRDALLLSENKENEKTLKEVLRIRNGKDYKHLNEGKYPVYGTGGIMTYVDKYAYDQPSVLIPRKGSLDKLYYVEEPFWTVDTIFYTEIDEMQVVPKYVYYFLQMLHLEDLNEAGGVPSLTQTVLNKVKIIVPPIDVQKRIVGILDKFDALINDISSGLPAEIEARQKQYEYYRDKLLSFKKADK